MSPVLRMTIGTIGTHASAAMWNPPLLNGPSAWVGERVPSGALAIEMPWRSLLTARFRVWCAGQGQGDVAAGCDGDIRASLSAAVEQ